MDAKTKELAGIAAAVAGHCQKCFLYHYNEAKRIGIEQNDIEEIIEFAKFIRAAGNQGMDEFIKRTIAQRSESK
ncbi:MAG: carboxymuconolactone decarboxylase family protein [Candidatus Omnitrophica bacterium]|nr:carboxymuconolactone decarboxylase family protein [Candidatus Omnitrophota bacterium]